MNYEDVIKQFTQQGNDESLFSEEEVKQFVDTFIEKALERGTEHSLYDWCVWVMNGQRGYTTEAEMALLPHVLQKLSGQ